MVPLEGTYYGTYLRDSSARVRIGDGRCFENETTEIL